MRVPHVIPNLAARTGGPPVAAVGSSMALARGGVDTRPFFLGMHEQPALIERGLFAGERYAVMERIARQGLYLPSGLTLSDGHIERVARIVRQEVSA